MSASHSAARRMNSLSFLVPLLLSLFHVGCDGKAGSQAPDRDASSTTRGLSPYCGNGRVDEGEECDDGNDAGTDACRKCRVVGVCGDGKRQGEEECDDNNDDPDDGCDQCLLTATCGDGRVDEALGEQCDDGNTSVNDQCANCRIVTWKPVCGDGIAHEAYGEECDDGNQLGGDGCEDCKMAPVCGDNIVEGEEECDDGNSEPGDGCDACFEVRQFCGDGIIDVDRGEQCDDGNRYSRDECANCQVLRHYCGDEVVDAGEECDDGNTNRLDGCHRCQRVAMCGNGVLEGAEECDDGNDVDGDGCSAACTPQSCGNGVLEDRESCELPSEGCPSEYTCSETCDACVPPTCGNGELDPDEQCDDGNAVEGDGCHACVWECGDGRADWTIGEECEPGVAVIPCLEAVTSYCVVCALGEPGCAQRDRCTNECSKTPICGDGLVNTQAGEACDFANPGANGLCTHDCQPRIPRCGDGLVQPGEECDDASETCENCRQVGCGNGIVQGTEQCELPGTRVCDDRCRFRALCLQQETRTLLPDPGTFALTDTTEDWRIAWIPEDKARVTLSRVEDGHDGPGSLEIVLDNGAQGGLAEKRGATLRFDQNRLQRNTVYQVTGYYKFPDWVSPSSGASITTLLYDNPACAGDPVQPVTVGARAPVVNDWAYYVGIIDTSIIPEPEVQLAADGTPLPPPPICLSIRLDVIRSAGSSKVSVLWDDVTMVVKTTECGNCVLDPGEQCDDGQMFGGDGCSAHCLLEACGNGIVDEGETCDDGNLTSGDGCSARCRDEATDACESCLATKQCVLGTDADQKDEPAPHPNVLERCLDDGTVISEGPAAGERQGALCAEVLDCIEGAQCDVAGGSLNGGNEDCYCGAAGKDSCAEPGRANGPCKKQIERALGTTDPATVLARFHGLDPKFPAVQRAFDLFTCERGSCTACPVNGNKHRGVCGDGIVQERSLAWFEGQTDGEPATDPARLFHSIYDPGTPSDPGLSCKALTTYAQADSGDSCFPTESCGCFIEECDDGNNRSGDGCDENCFAEHGGCGNGLIQPREECDDGNTQPGDFCSTECKLTVHCGDGKFEYPEECDAPWSGSKLCSLADFEANPTGCYCSADCKLSLCGNGRQDEGEECDVPGSTLCSPECKKTASSSACIECIQGLADDPDIGFIVDYFAQSCEPVAACVEALQCFGGTGCYSLADPNQYCFCGAGISYEECVDPSFTPDGACTAEVLAGFSSSDNQYIVDNAQEPTQPAGNALLIYTSLRTGGTYYCQQECGY